MLIGYGGSVLLAGSGTRIDAGVWKTLSRIRGVGTAHPRTRERVTLDAPELALLRRISHIEQDRMIIRFDATKPPYAGRSVSLAIHGCRAGGHGIVFLTRGTLYEDLLRSRHRLENRGGHVKAIMTIRTRNL